MIDVDHRLRRGASSGRHAPGAGLPRVAATLVLALAAVTALSAGCAVDAALTPAPSPVSTAPLLDDGWTSAGGAEFLPAPAAAPARAHDAGVTLVAATGSRARVKWLAERAGVDGPEDASSTLIVRVVDITDPDARADVRFRGAGGSGTVDLPIDPGKRTLYRLSYEATGTFARCAVLLEVHE